MRLIALGWCWSCCLAAGKLAAAETGLEAPDAVVIGKLDEDRALRAGIRTSGPYRLADSKLDFSWWCAIGIVHRDAQVLSTACLNELRQLRPSQRVLITQFIPAVTAVTSDSRDCLVTFGSRVPIPVVVAVLRATRKWTPGRVLVQAGSDEEGLISVGSPRPEVGKAIDAKAWEQLDAAGKDEKALRKILDRFTPPVKTATPLAEPPTRMTLDLDLRSQDGQAPTLARNGTWKNVTWTPAGLELRGAPLTHVDGRMPRAPYVAELPIPGISSGDRATTVTLVLWMADWQVAIDNLFTIGRRSRWLTAHAEADGAVRAGLDNHFALFPKLGNAPLELPPISKGAWHAVSVAKTRAGTRILIAVDGRISRDLHAHELPWDSDPDGPQRFDAASEDLFSFVDFGTARHFHGVVQRLIVHAGSLERPALTALHAELGIARLTPPAPLPELPLRARPAPEPGPAEPAEKNDQPLNF